MCGPKQKVLVLGQGFGNLGPDLLCEQKSVGPAYHMGSSEKEEPFPECWERGMFRRYVSGYVSGCVSGYVSHEIVVVVVAAAVVVAIVVVVVAVVAVCFGVCFAQGQQSSKIINGTPRKLTDPCMVSYGLRALCLCF